MLIAEAGDLADKTIGVFSTTMVVLPDGANNIFFIYVSVYRL